MSNSGVNTGFAKCFILFIAIVILLQGIVYLGLSIWGLFLYSCSDQTADISSEPFKFVIDLVYFLDESCGTATINENVTLTVDWATSELITHRMEIFLIIYLVLSALWIITSLAVISTICAPVTTCVAAVCFWPWFLVVMACSILDAVATGFHISDIVHTTTAEDTFNYVGISINPEIMNAIRSYDPYFVTPAVMMTCISSRVVLLWLLNIFGVIFCFSLSRMLAKRQSAIVIAARSKPVAAASSDNAAPQQLIVQAEIIEQAPMQIQPKPLTMQAPIAAVTIQRQNSNVGNKRSSEQQAYLPSAPANTDIATAAAATTYRNSAAHPDNLNYPMQAIEPASTRAMSPVPAAPATPFRFVNNENPNVAPVTPSQPQRVSAELRSQLPWSYTSMPAGNAGRPQTPRKPQVQIYPEIPEPDYGDQQASQEGYTRW